MTTLIGQSLGRYHILEQLGEGGMATVYKAFDTRLERDVAVKVIRVDQFALAVLERVLKRFEREAKALARLTHPNIVHINDYGEQDDIPYLVMDYLPGGTLKQRLGKPMPWQKAVRLLLPVAEALDYAHSQNIIHRDVKPSNILLTQHGQPMLTDFGIAKLLEGEQAQTLTGTGAGVGTPEYMAPEQVDASSVDKRADIYSLGIVLYELITGRKPFRADTPMAVMIMQARDPLPRPGQFIRDLPEAMEKVLLKALAKKPEDRYQSMGEFTIALENMASRHPAMESKEEEVKSTSNDHTVPGASLREETRSTLDQGSAREKVVPAATPRSSPPPAIKFGKNRWLPWAGAAAAIILIMFLSYLFGKGSAPQATPAPLPTMTASLEPSPTPGPGSTLKRDADGMIMVYVSAGEFTMGSNDLLFNETPIHKVFLNPFWIDQTEVTNNMFQAFVNATGYITDAQKAGTSMVFTDTNQAAATKGATWKQPLGSQSGLGIVGLEQHPVVQVSWNDAIAYCAWASARLPSEAEWEKAARGTEGHTWPWGTQSPDETLLNSADASLYGTSQGPSDGNKYTAPAGSYPTGASPFTAYDMSGNVYEWVEDWYGESYYADSPFNNPPGPAFGQERVYKGGSWKETLLLLRPAGRFFALPYYADNNLGFRCARSGAATQSDPGTPPPVAVLAPATITPEPTKSLTPASADISLFEDFNDSSAFSFTTNNIYIKNGQIVWNVSRNGGDQFAYRTIPSFSGNVSISAVGQVNTATNNCGGLIGIGDKPGNGIAISFGWFGGGCSKSGYLIDAWKGISLDHSMDGCSFIGTWLWVDNGRNFTATLDTGNSSANLSVANIGSVKGTTNYDGPYTTLWIGLGGDGDWPSCGGSFESVQIEQLP